MNNAVTTERGRRFMSTAWVFTTWVRLSGLNQCGFAHARGLWTPRFQCPQQAKRILGSFRCCVPVAFVEVNNAVQFSHTEILMPDKALVLMRRFQAVCLE